MSSCALSPLDTLKYAQMATNVNNNQGATHNDNDEGDIMDKISVLPSGSNGGSSDNAQAVDQLLGDLTGETQGSRRFGSWVRDFVRANSYNSRSQSTDNLDQTSIDQTLQGTDCDCEENESDDFSE